MKRRSLLIGSILTSLGLANKIYDSQINTEEEKQSKNKHYDPPWKVKVNNFNLNHIEHRKNELYIHHINVGQADATFIKTPNGKNILIDSGHAIDNGVFVLDYLKSYSINHLDYFILTHPHWDHIGGTKRIIETYEQKLNGISKILETKQKNETYTYKEYRDILNKYPRKVEKIDENVELDWDTNIKVTILNPTEKLDKELTINNKSIALHIEHNNNSIILPSDIEKETENRIIKKYGSKIESDIYRIAHHGDRRSNSDPFLNQINPEYAIISSPHDSRWKHPHKEVLNKLSKREIKTYWTAIHGSIVTVSDGEKWNIYPQLNKTTKPKKLREKQKVSVYPASGVSKD